VSLEYVRADVLRNVHGRIIQNYGGVSGVRDENGLESAIARPKNLAFYAGVESIGALAATHAWALLRNHPFADGNKRAAFAGLAMFLELNGYRLICSEVEETAMMIRAAGSEIDEGEWTAWVERSVAPKAV
jgi:death on curing protein